MKNTEEGAQGADAAFQEACRVIRRLRAPGGCPWDREQTPLTLRESLIEEAYEAVEAITEGNAEHVQEELGDVLLNALMIALIYEERGEFTVADAFAALSEKLVRRHPHVFAGQDDAKKAATSDEVLAQWDKIKRDVEGKKADGLLGGMSEALPPLAAAQKMQKKAARAGFDFPLVEGIWDKLKEEAEELSAEVKALEGGAGSQARVEEEAGDLLFVAANLLRRLNVNAEAALLAANAKFRRRFGYIENALKERGGSLDAATLEEMDALWDEAKQKGL